MVKVENLVIPSPEWWNVAIKGMRNSYKSGGKSDSKQCNSPFLDNITRRDCEKCILSEDECDDGFNGFILGETDKNLLLNLCKAGTSHRKVLRQLPVIMDITAPLYWWKQMDQYKLGTVTNSESTMHTLMNKEFELEDFSFDIFRKKKDLDPNDLRTEDFDYINALGSSILDLNFIREAFISGNSEAEIIINELLPQSYNQKRTWSANYEVLVNIIQQRRGHKLKEWDDFIDCLLENVPYLKEIVKDIDG